MLDDGGVDAPPLAARAARARRGRARGASGSSRPTSRPTASLRSFLLHRVDNGARSRAQAVRGARRRPRRRRGRPGVDWRRRIRDSSAGQRPTGRCLVRRLLAAEAARDDSSLVRRSNAQRPSATATSPCGRGGTASYRVRASIEPQDPDSVLIVARPLHDVDGTLHRLLLIELLVTARRARGARCARLCGSCGSACARSRDRDAPPPRSPPATSRAASSQRRPQTEVGRLGLALNAMLDQIEASDRRLRRFVADASHELRTPLAAVRAYAELFGRGAAERPDDLERSMTGITRESERMSLLVDDLLLLARLDEGRPLEREAGRARRRRPRGRRRGARRRAGPADRARRRAGDRARRPRPAAPGRRQPARQRARAHAGRDAGRGRASAARRRRGARGRRPRPRPERGAGGARLRALLPRRPSRARASGGVGLGLSIVAAVAEAHGGTAGSSRRPAAARRSCRAAARRRLGGEVFGEV